jgi:phenylpyruvate tautomerase PptA (4-oxalocrotonate tautomerase family)
MPFVRISFASPTSPERRRAVADAVHDALVETAGVPANDRFQIVETSGEVIFDRSYLGDRDEGLAMIEVHLSFGRSTETKQAFFAALAARMARAGVEPRNVFAHLVETGRENWSFGDGIAQYVLAPPAALVSPAGPA